MEEKKIEIEIFFDPPSLSSESGSPEQIIKDWQTFLFIVKQRQKDRLPQNEWFKPPDKICKFVQKSITKANEGALQIQSKQDVQKILSKLDKEIDFKMPFYWLLLCRRLSTPPSFGREVVFQNITDYLGEKIANAAQAAKGKKAILTAAVFLTTCATKYGAEAFLLSLAKTKFPSNQGREEILKWIEEEIHPQLYTPHQFLRAARTVFDEHLITDQQRSYFSNLFARRFTPEGKFTLHEKLIYGDTKTLDHYERGEAMIQTDLEVLIQAGLSPGKRIVDFAAGTGRQVEQLLSRGYNVVACDLNFSYLHQLQRKRPEGVKTIQANWFHAPFPDNHFDLGILLGRDMPHMVNSFERQKFLKEARRVIKKGGKLVFDLPDVTLGEYKIKSQDNKRFFQGWIEPTEDSHLILDSMDNLLFTFRVFPELNQVISESHKCGFKITDALFRDIPNTQARNLYIVLEAT